MKEYLDMGVDVYSYLVIGLLLPEEYVYEKKVACGRCYKAEVTAYCPDCGERIKEQLVMRQKFQDLRDIENDGIVSTGTGSRKWYLVLRKYKSVAYRGESPVQMIPLQAFNISPQEMADFELKAQKLGVWDKDKFGVHVFLHYSY